MVAMEEIHGTGHAMTIDSGTMMDTIARHYANLDAIRMRTAAKFGQDGQHELRNLLRYALSPLNRDPVLTIRCTARSLRRIRRALTCCPFCFGDVDGCRPSSPQCEAGRTRRIYV